MVQNKKEKKCFICSKIIKSMFITYMPYKDYLCNNHCLIEYRKNIKE